MHEEHTRVPRLLTVREVAQRLNVGVRSVWAWIASGRLKAIKLSKRCTRVRETDLGSFLAHAARE